MSIKAGLHGGIYSIDLPSGPPQLPTDPEDCWVRVYADIGAVDEVGADTFLFYVCTPKRLQTMVKRAGYYLGRHLVIVDHFAWDLVERIISSICDETTGDTWEEVATKLGRYGLWEFEDYQEAPSKSEPDK